MEGGAPIALLDAQATGLPVLSTRHCDIPFEVEHERTGLLARRRYTRVGCLYHPLCSLDQEACDSSHRKLKGVEEEFSISFGGNSMRFVPEIVNPLKLKIDAHSFDHLPLFFRKRMRELIAG